MFNFAKILKCFKACSSCKDSLSAVLTIMTLLGVCTPVWAAVRNEVNVDAGQLLHELEPERHVMPDPDMPEVEIKTPNLEQQGSEDKIFIKKINFGWREKDQIEKLDPKYHDKWYHLKKSVAEYEIERLEKIGHEAIDGELGRELTFNELVKLAEKVTLKMREAGYTTALAYLPQQQMQDQTIVMNVMLGTYDSVNIKNTSMLANSRAAGITKKLKKGALITNKTINKSIMVLNDTPGVIAKASLVPGSLPGTATLELDVANLEKQGAVVYTDNHGSRSTGRYRYGLGYHYNNLTKSGDSLTVNYMTSNLRNMDNYSVQYESLFDNNGSKWRASYSRMTYDIMSKSNLNYIGSSKTLEIGTSIPMERDILKSNFLDLSYKHRLIGDDIVGEVLPGQKYTIESSKSSDVVEATIKGYTRSKHDSLNYYFINTLGWVRPNTPYAEQSSDASNNANRFEKSYLSLYYVYQLNKALSLHTSASGQWSWGKNLDSSEDFYIGGPNAVRAFTSGEASGDVGAVGTVEFRYQTKLPELSLTAFYDLGYVRYNAKKMDDVIGSNSRTLAAAGIGAIFNKSRDYYMKLDFAVPLSNKYSESYGRKNDYMIWYRLVKQI